MAAALAHTVIPSKAFQVHNLAMAPFLSTTSAIEARLISQSPSDFMLNHVPICVHVNRPLELELASIGLGAGADVAESLASWISTHALIQISVEVPGHPRREVSVLVKARPSKGGWIVRVLVRPAYWADAASVTVVSLSLAGQPLPCECLPATLRGGYNHAPAPEGAIFAAAWAGDVPALRVALDAGGSTEEADTVRGGERGGTHGDQRRGAVKTAPPLPLRFLLFCRTAALRPSGPHATATSRRSARSWRQAPTRPQPTRYEEGRGGLRGG